MCLIVFAWQVVPGVPLLAAGNRDEFHARPSSIADWWSDHPQIYAGRDLRSGGTWIGITREGRFATVTNIRGPAYPKRDDAPSRGTLVSDFLACELTPSAYVEKIAPEAKLYNGFNLLVGTRDELIWYSNGSPDDERNGKPLPPGIYGVSNGSLDTPWPKVVRTKAEFASLLCQDAPQEAYFEMLADTTIAPDCRLPDTGLPIEWERILSAVCIQSPEYGTRASTLVTLTTTEAILLERQIA